MPDVSTLHRCKSSRVAEHLASKRFDLLELDSADSWAGAARHTRRGRVLARHRNGVRLLVVVTHIDHRGAGGYRTLHSRRPGFARMIEPASAAVGLGHPHMLRHACGNALANKGHDTRAIQGWLGHRSITSTAVYTALAPNRFKDFGRK
jgi:integrase